MQSDIAISVKNVSKTFRIPHEKVSSLRGAAVSLFSKNRGYEEFKALDDVSFEVKKGEFFGIIGRNGSGKSTLLKILAGIYQSDKGKVKINGRISPFLELGIGFNPELSGRDNVYLNATVLGLTKKEIDEKFDSIVKFSELERFIDQKLKNYSSGMQVRLAFSVSIHANREILLMDEVLAVGDSNFQSKCLAEFAKYRDMGKTVILVTHDIATVQRYCDRAMLVRNGKVIAFGKADEVTNKYICFNIDDEENRLTDNNNLKVAKRKNNRIVEILKVTINDDNGDSKNNFQAGENISLLIDFKANHFVKDLSFRVSVESTDRIYLFGSDTFSGNVKISSETGKRQLLFKIINNPILEGEYFFNVSCFKQNGSVPLDYRPDCAKFKIFPSTHLSGYKGLVKLTHEWKQID